MVTYIEVKNPSILLWDSASPWLVPVSRIPRKQPQNPNIRSLKNAMVNLDPPNFLDLKFFQNLMTQKPKLEKNKWFVFGIKFWIKYDKLIKPPT